MGWESEIWKKPIPDPGVKKSTGPDPGSSALIVLYRVLGTYTFSGTASNVLIEKVGTGILRYKKLGNSEMFAF